MGLIYFIKWCCWISHFLRCVVVKAVATPDSAVELPLTADNVESVLDEVRPYLISDGGNVALHEIDGNVVRLKLQGACSSCSASVMTMKMGIERRLMEKIPEIVAVEAVADEETGLELNGENIEKVIKLKPLFSVLTYIALEWNWTVFKLWTTSRKDPRCSGKRRKKKDSKMLNCRIKIAKKKEEQSV